MGDTGGDDSGRDGSDGSSVGSSDDTGGGGSASSGTADAGESGRGERRSKRSRSRMRARGRARARAFARRDQERGRFREGADACFDIRACAKQKGSTGVFGDDTFRTYAGVRGGLAGVFCGHRRPPETPPRDTTPPQTHVHDIISITNCYAKVSRAACVTAHPVWQPGAPLHV